ncbi:MAG: dihydroneopterin aldolase [Burkholderiales bacterium]|jgi:dihydroneopterin aldolase
MPTIDLHIILNTEIGILPSEQGRPQPITVQLSVDIDPQACAQAGHSGCIEQTLDYSGLRQVVLDVFNEQRFNLLEEPALRIKHRVELLSRVRAARISLVKEHPWPDVPFVKVSV